MLYRAVTNLLPSSEQLLPSVAPSVGATLTVAYSPEKEALFEELVRQGTTLMVVTHDRSLSERTERVLHLLDGRLHRDENNGRYVR